MKAKAWLLAARPKTLTASLIPVFVGTALAYANQGFFDWLLALSALVTALLIQTGINFFNDAFDFERGKDTEERLGPPRASQQGWLGVGEIKRAGFLVFALALVAATPLVLSGGFLFLFLILLCLLFGYAYTGGPYPLAYHALGDLFALIFFGWVATGISYGVQTGGYGPEPLLAGTILGCLATVILAVNNLRDIEEDRKTGKRTLAVLIGKKHARMEITLLIFAAFLLNLSWSSYGFFLAALLPCSLLPLATLLLQFIWTREPGPRYNGYLAFAVILHFVFGLLLATGLFLQ